MDSFGSNYDTISKSAHIQFSRPVSFDLYRNFISHLEQNLPCKVSWLPDREQKLRTKNGEYSFHYLVNKSGTKVKGIEFLVDKDISLKNFDPMAVDAWESVNSHSQRYFVNK